MSLKYESILGIKICVSPKSEILEFLKKAIKNQPKKAGKAGQLPLQPLVVTTPNPEQVMLGRSNGVFQKVINESDVAIPDGIGLVWAGRVFDLSGPAVRVSGVDLMSELVTLAEKEGVRIGLIGGKGRVALDALECLRRKYPELEGAAWEGPNVRCANYDLRITNQNDNNISPEREKESSWDEDITAAAQEVEAWITKNRLGIVFVGMGAPKQGLLVREVVRTMGRKQKRRMGNGELRIIMSVGGAFDMIAGRTPRAPVWAREMGLEWLWRLILEPWRLRRQLALLTFAATVVLKRIEQEIFGFVK